MAAPANDNVANATILTTGSQVTGSTTEATSEVGEVRYTTNLVAFSGTGSTGLRTVWFRFTPFLTGFAQFSTVGSAFDTYLCMYVTKAGVTTVASQADLDIVTANDDDGGSSTSLINYPVTAGTEYWFQVAGFDNTMFGSYVFNYPAPFNPTSPLAGSGTVAVTAFNVPRLGDDLAYGTVLQNGSTQYTGSTANYSGEPGEVKGTSDSTATVTAAAFKTAWHLWRAPSNASATITTTGSSFDTYLTVFTKAVGQTDPVQSVTGLTIVASNDDGGGGGTSSVTFTPVSGTVYYVQVAGFSGTDSGPYTLNYPSPASSAPPSTDVPTGTAEVATAGQNALGVVPSLFSTQTPTGTNNSDGTPGITTATTERFAVAGYVNAIRFYATTTVSGTYTGALWQVTHDDNPGPASGTLLASKIRPTLPVAAGWNLIVFDTPVPVVPGVLYRAGVHSSDGRYVNTTGAFAADIVNGQITADFDGDDPVLLGSLLQGVFAINAALTYPSSGFGSSSYFVDVDFSLTTATSATANAGAAAVTVDSAPAAASVAVPAGQAAVAADALNATTVTVASTSVTAGSAAVTAASFNPAAAVAYAAQAGQAAVSVDGYNPAAATVPVVTAPAGAADVTTDAYLAPATVTVNTGQADVSIDAYGAAVSTSSNVTTTAGLADVNVTGHNATVTIDTTAVAGVAAVGVDGFSPGVAVTAQPGPADVTATGHNATVVSATTAVTGSAAVAADAYTATTVTTAEGLGNPGTADAFADAYNAQPQPVLTVTAGHAAVGADGYGPTVSAVAATTVDAGTADVGTDAHSGQILTTVIATPTPAQVGADAYTVVVQSAATTDVPAVAALASAQAFNALVVLGVSAGQADVSTVAFDVPKQRVPGTFTAGTRRSRLTAGTLHGPTYTAGGTP